jgi:hypothetical protein
MTLTAKYVEDFFTYPNVENDPLFKDYSLNDTRITEELYHYLWPKVDQRLALSLFSRILHSHHTLL